jgi:hypothetical protein
MEITNMKKGKLILTTLLSTVCAAAFAGEYTTSVDYRSFHCTVAEQSKTDSFKQIFKDAQVKFDTQNILLRGADAGQPYVSTKGHIDYQPLSVFDNYYFETERDGVKDGKVVITVSGVDEQNFRLDCVEGHGDGLALYGEGSNPAL